MLSRRQKNLAILRVVQILIAFLLFFESYTALRMTIFNMSLSQNESLRFVQAAEEIYTETYEKVSAAKSEFKQNNTIANLPIAGRLTLYVATISLFVLVTSKRNRVVKRTYKKAAATMPEKSPMNSSNLRVDIAKFYY